MPLGVLLHRVPDVRQPPARPHLLDRQPQASSVTLSSRCASSLDLADRERARRVPEVPLVDDPQSIPTMSPSRSGRSFGMPCTITSLTEMHSVAG